MSQSRFYFGYFKEIVRSNQETATHLFLIFFHFDIKIPVLPVPYFFLLSFYISFSKLFNSSEAALKFKAMEILAKKIPWRDDDPNYIWQWCFVINVERKFTIVTIKVFNQFSPYEVSKVLPASGFNIETRLSLKYQE